MTGRAPIVLRDADVEDAAALVDLWSECADAGGDDSEGSPQNLWRKPDVAEAAEAVALHLARPDKRVIVAVVDGVVVGATVCEVTTLTPVTLTRVLLVTDIQVSPRHRKRSVASTLLSAAAAHGDDHGCEIVVAAIPSHAREPHRYLTKIGFNQIAVLRAIQASKLQSRLTSKTGISRDTGKLIAVRRTLRRRQGGRRPDRSQSH